MPLACPQSLKNTSLAHICMLINRAFQGYAVSIQMTIDVLLRKIQAESIDLERSVGLYDEDELVGVLLLGYRGTASYNACTGLLPAYRGQGYADTMYDYAKTHFLNDGILETHILEVLEANTSGIRLYERLGMQKTDFLYTFFLTLPQQSKTDFLGIRPLSYTDFFEFYNNEKIFGAECAWQNAPLPGLQSGFSKAYGWYAPDTGELSALVVFRADTNTVQYLNVLTEQRLHGLGRLMLAFVQQQLGKAPLRLLNVSARNSSVIYLAKALGAELKFKQWEMQTRLK